MNLSPSAAPLVSVLTASPGRERLGFLRATYASLRVSLEAAGVDWEWALEIDGPPENYLPADVFPDPRVRLGTHGVKTGPATCRNLALARTRGHWVLLLDDDDLLPAGAMTALLAAASANQGAWWLTGRGENLYPDGRREDWPARFPIGPIAAGELTRRTLEFGHVPLHTMTGLFRRELLVALGGWPALIRDEDSALWLFVGELKDGVIIDDLTYIYRRWPDQTMAKPWFNDRALISRSRTLIAARIEAMSELDLAADRPVAPRDWSRFINAAPEVTPFRKG
jgi:glycosyltransferase involved in cell wall biosynthesis